MKPWVIVVCLVNLVIQLLMWRRLRQYARRAREAQELSQKPGHDVPKRSG